MGNCCMLSQRLSSCLPWSSVGHSATRCEPSGHVVHKNCVHDPVDLSTGWFVVLGEYAEHEFPAASLDSHPKAHVGLAGRFPKLSKSSVSVFNIARGGQDEHDEAQEEAQHRGKMVIGARSDSQGKMAIRSEIGSQGKMAIGSQTDRGNVVIGPRTAFVSK